MFLGQIWKGLQNCSQEVLGYFFDDDSVGPQKSRTWAVSTMPTQWMEMETLLEIGLKAICVTLRQRTCLYFVYTLVLSGRGNFKAAPHIAVAWVLLLARFRENIGDEGQNREI